MSQNCPHCGARLREYRIVYGATRSFGETWEEGYRCKKCKAIRLPGPKLSGGKYFHAPFTRGQWEIYQQNLRDEGREDLLQDYDEAVLKNTTPRQDPRSNEDLQPSL